MKVVLLSHSLQINGTPEASNLLKLVAKYFPSSVWNLFYLNGMEIGTPFDFNQIVVEHSDYVLITEHQNAIGYGQFWLLNYTLRLGKPVSLLRKIGLRYHLHDITGFRIIREDYKLRYAEVITK